MDKVTGKEVSPDIEKIDQHLLTMLPPQNYQGHKGAEVQMIKAYERAVAVMSQHISQNPKTMTVLAFYETLAALKEQNKPKYQVNGKPH